VLCARCNSAVEPDATACFNCGYEISPRAHSIVRGTLVADRYEVLERLGRGGMGEVYRAYDRVLEEDVALKVLREEATERDDIARRFRTEIRLARKVTHKNVCRIHEYGEWQGRGYISMELVRGINLRQLLKETGALPWDRAFEIALQVVEGLQAIHEVGIVHRDLKPANIMIDKAHVVRLMDFGVAKQIRGGVAATAATATGQVIGTPDYMSPEQATAQPVDFRSDVYALGVIVFEMFTGEQPFQADSPVAVLMKHIHEMPALVGPASARTPEKVVPILAKALAKRPEDRYQTIGELRDDLARARTSTESVGPPIYSKGSASALADLATRTSGYPAPGPSGSRQRTSAWAAIALTVVATAGISVMLLRRVPVVAPMAPAAFQPVTAAPRNQLVSFNALPWARIRLTPLGRTSAPPDLSDDERTTPCALLLPAGEYLAELENGGVTPGLAEKILVKDGVRNEFVFTMPSYEPERAAAGASQP
jgi:serine/threonine-protein kinase